MIVLRQGLVRTACLSKSASARVAVARFASKSAKPAAENDKTPAKTRLVFNESVYGDDGESTSTISPELAKELRKEAEKTAGGKAGISRVSKAHSRQSLYDDEMIQSGDTKTLKDVARTPKTGTPDATRVTMFGTAYGKDHYTDEAVDAIEGLKKTAEKPKKPKKVSAVHHPRSLYDSDYGDAAAHEGSQDIKRTVKTGTPDTTRVVMFASTYGKDHYPDEAVNAVEDLKKTAEKPKKTKKVPAVHHPRSLFDSDYGHAAEHESSKDIKRTVKTNTPDATRVVMFGTAYGKDHYTDEDVNAIEDLKFTAEKPQKPKKVPAVHHPRALFDSDYGHAAEHESSEDIKRTVKTNTPDATRVVMFASGTYGKDHYPDEVVNAVEKLIETAEKPQKPKKVPAVHHPRALFDSDYGHAAGHESSEDIKRTVKTLTPDATRVVMFGTAYGKDHYPDEAVNAVEKLIKTAEKPQKPKKVSAVHSRQAMFDSDYGHAAEHEQYQDVKKVVKADTPELSRLSMYDSDYGHAAPEPENLPLDLDKIKKTAGKRATHKKVSGIHSKQALFDSVYGHSHTKDKNEDK